MKNLFLGTVAAFAIVAAPMAVSAQEAGGSKKEMTGGSSGGGGRMEPGGGMKSGGDAGMKDRSGPGPDADMKTGRDKDRAGGAMDEKSRSGGDADMKSGAKDHGGKDGSARNSLGGSSMTTVKVTAEQKTTIRQKLVISGAGGNRVSKTSLGGVSFSVGVKLPREKVRISRLPTEIIQLVPEYSEYEYFVTDDGLIVIVDPDTYEIVDVIEA